MKVVLLAGGFGTRISKETEFMPKPMIEIGGMPILWHIMKEYSYYGFYEFIVCAGYKQHIIKEWFADYFLHTSDITFDFTKGNEVIVHNKYSEPWKVTVVDTGLNTMTGGRIKRIYPYIDDENFMMTYGDGVCDVNIRKLLDFHREHGKIATLTAVMQEEQKGVLDIGGDNAVRSFREKNARDSKPINAGYMVLNKKIFEYLDGDEVVFEREPLQRLVKEGELMSYMHQGFWQCMDTEREMLRVLRNQASKCFVTQKYITREQQQQWYKTYLEKQNDYMFKVVLCSNPDEFVGAVALYDIDKKKGTAEFGRIIVDNKKVQGIGRDIVDAICRFGYDEFELIKIICTVFKDNEKAVQIYKKNGFKIIGEKNGLLYMEKCNESTKR